jgi:hypothetical protein
MVCDRKLLSSFSQALSAVLCCAALAGGRGRGPPPQQRRRDSLPEDVTLVTELKRHEKVNR